MPIDLSTTTTPTPRHQLLAAGATRGELAGRLRRGELVVAAPGVYVRADVADEAARDPLDAHLLLVRAMARAVADDAVASHESAAIAHGLPLLGVPPGLALFTRPQPGRRTGDRTPWARTYVAGLPPDHVTTVQGLATTSVARTVVDLARRRSLRASVTTCDAALRAGVTKDGLRAVLADCRNWPYVRRAGFTVDFADARAESVFESVARVVLVHELGLPAPDLQVDLGDVAFVGRVDMLFRAQATVVETDGRVKYDNPAALWAEKLREDRLRDMGFEVVRITWADLRHPTRLQAKLLTAFARAERRASA